MTKRQKMIIAKAKKLGLNSAQMKFLSRTDIHPVHIENTFKVFFVSPSFTPDAAYEFVKSGGHYSMLRFENGKSLSFAEYKRLPAVVREKPDFLQKIKALKPHVVGEEKTSFVPFVKWVCSFLDEAVWLFEIRELINDPVVSLSSREKSWKIDKDTFQKFYLLCSKLLLWAKSDLLDEAVQFSMEYYKDRNCGTAYERNFQAAAKKRVASGNLHDIEWINFVRNKIGGKVYAKRIFGDGKNAEQAFSDIVAMVQQRETETFSIQDFYAMFSGFPSEREVIGFKNDAQRQEYETFFSFNSLTGFLDIPAYKICISIPVEKVGDKPIFFSFYEAKQVHVSGDSRSLTNSHGVGLYDKPVRMIVFKDGKIFRTYRERYAPVSVRDVVKYFDQSGAADVFAKILDLPAIRESYLFKDLIADCRLSLLNNKTFPSILWNDCIGYKNRNHFMRAKYKDADGIDFNKLGLPCGYAYMKTRPFVDEKSQGILYNAFTTKAIKAYFCKDARKKDSIAAAVATEYLADKLRKNNPNNDRIDVEVADYVRNALGAKEKINLRWNSLRKVEQRNVDLVLAGRNRMTPEIRIPEKSKFKILAKKLPPDFEYIKTKERIIEEGAKMRHCVASYADFVNQDVCAIYHLEHGGCGYTVEFKKQGRDFYVNQIQSKADRGAPDEVWLYVEGEISKITGRPALSRGIPGAPAAHFDDDIPF